MIVCILVLLISIGCKNRLVCESKIISIRGTGSHHYSEAIEVCFEDGTFLLTGREDLSYIKVGSFYRVYYNPNGESYIYERFFPEENGDKK